MKRIGVIKAADAVNHHIEMAGENIETMHPRHQPMVARPLPWTSAERVGSDAMSPCFELRCDIFSGRIPHYSGSDYEAQVSYAGDVHQTFAFLPLENNCAELFRQLQLLRRYEKNMTRLYAGLNALGATRWCIIPNVSSILPPSCCLPTFQPLVLFSSRFNVFCCCRSINDRVFDVMHTVWEAGGGIAGVPPRANLPLPLLPMLSKSLESTADAAAKNAKFQAMKQLKSVMKHNAELHSLRTDFMYKLETARVYLKHEFYFPHNVDFRGRAYPMPIHLHHLGSDVCRGLLRFAERKPLQARGLFWLQVHLANLFGKNKMNFDGRVNWTIQNRENILSAAADPLGPAKTWWIEADEPWQALAVCFELAEVTTSKANRIYHIVTLA
jgi:DNA-directed RNA polymerase